MDTKSRVYVARLPAVRCVMLFVYSLMFLQRFDNQDVQDLFKKFGKIRSVDMKTGFCERTRIPSPYRAAELTSLCFV